ncbi:response regulator transcription factor [Hazenella sp. IB182357]|uniref:Response regulator transcription factor n=1 Tax=Polycladospora coralii TaxID=2771432 RepID=A0A926NB58_9BACL|nr:LuxR C-terminal-related transcriptional regulator [Polycladospora coralii]MBD1373327.1 response regulator transcription factor [Polycladospora coralii]
MIHDEITQFMKKIESICDLEMRIKVLLKGSAEYFQVERASIFTYSPINAMGQGVVRMDLDGIFSITNILEDVRNIPSLHAMISTSQIDYLLLDQIPPTFPTKYIKQFNLSSLLIIPLRYFATVFGCILIDPIIQNKQIDSLHIQKIVYYFQQSSHIFNPQMKGRKLLSPRERQALYYLSKGLNTKEIAHELLISEFTVRDYVCSAIKKLGAQHRTEAVAIALRQKMID